MKNPKLAGLLLLGLLTVGARPTPARAEGEELIRTSAEGMDSEDLLEMILETAIREQSFAKPTLDAETGALVIGFLVIPEIGVSSDQLKDIHRIISARGTWTAPSGTLYDFRQTGLELPIDTFMREGAAKLRDILRRLMEVPPVASADITVTPGSAAVDMSQVRFFITGSDDPAGELFTRFPESVRARLNSGALLGSPSTGCLRALRGITKEL